jgi:integrase
MATRHPKGGRGRRWTVKELEAVKAEWKGETLADGEGLTGEVRVSNHAAVSVYWRMAFKWEGKVKWHYCGGWPLLNMESVRAERDRARILVKDGVHPGQERKAAKIEAQQKVQATISEAARQATHNLPWRGMYDDWLENGVSRLDGNADIRRTFEKDLLPVLGAMPVKEVTEVHLRDALRIVGRARGSGRTAEKMAADVRQFYKWSIKRKPWRTLLIEGNPADLLDDEQIVPFGYESKIDTRVLSPNELRELKGHFQNLKEAHESLTVGSKYESPLPFKETSELALWISLSTTCRIGELLKAKWENVDLIKGEWFVPGENTKTKVDWLVLLSPFAKRQFNALYDLTGHTPFCFPARVKGRARDGVQETATTHVYLKAVTKQVGDRQVQFMNRKDPLAHRINDNSLVLVSEKKGLWTPHDMRRTSATMMQKLRVPTDIIDRCLNHKLKSTKAGGHYLHYEFADEKRSAWTALGTQLDQEFEILALKISV